MSKGNAGRRFEQKGERGIAMLVAVFALLLLSVVGLGMMYATNMETAINGNYRDKQVAIYASMGGLQEARDRLRLYDPTQAIPAGRIQGPAGLPSLTDANVVYILNPKNGETVAPWLDTNPYFDTELCQERMLGLTGTPGVPCSSVPSGGAWYRTYDDSDAGAAGFWNLANPLDFKWIRISLKMNNNTPVASNGNTGDPAQVCWDGTRQLVLPSGYGLECI